MMRGRSPFSKEEKQIADMMTGLANDRTSEELRELRELRSKASANARVSRELAGMDSAKAETSSLGIRSKHRADNEFDALIGISNKKVNEAPAQDTKIPEA